MTLRRRLLPGMLLALLLSGTALAVEPSEMLKDPALEAKYKLRYRTSYYSDAK